jgi:hypothetical protein
MLTRRVARAEARSPGRGPADRAAPAGGSGYGQGVGRVDDYRAALRALPPAGWDAYLAEHSGLPGPRGNLELLAAVAELAPPDMLWRYAHSADEYRASCGAAGLGRLVAQGDERALSALRGLASDGRWRVREGVAMALQRVGDSDSRLLLRIAADWAGDPHPLVKRAAVAGPCEPRLLADTEVAGRVLALLDTVTEALARWPSSGRRDPQLRTLRQALGYCWSVAVAAAPGPGFDRLERWARSADADVRWILRENLKKARLRTAAPDRYERLRTALA